MPDVRQDRGRLLLGGLVAVFVLVIGLGAWQLAHAQRTTRTALRQRFEQRSLISASLFDGLFKAVLPGTAKQLPQLSFGGATVQTETLDDYVRQQGSVFTLVADARSGRVLGHSTGTPSSMLSGALQPFERIALRHGYGLSDLIPGSSPAIASAVPYRAADGSLRFLVNAAPAANYTSFLAGSLKPVAPVTGGGAFIFDSRGRSLTALTGDPSLTGHLSRDVTLGNGDQISSPEGRLALSSTAAPGTGWRIVLAVSAKRLYAPASGFGGRLVPWIILALFAVALAGAAWLVGRVVAVRRQVEHANERLEGANERLNELNADLVRSNSDLEQFAYVASHDLSSPLRSIAGFSSLLARRYGGKLDDDADKYIGFVQEGVDRMQRIIDDLLAYSRVGSRLEAAEPVDLDDLISSLERSMAADIDSSGAEITHDPLPTVYGERPQLAQLMQNLLGNAMTYVAPGVTPRIHVSAEPIGEERVRVKVADNGIGIDPAQTERIFKMFQRLHTRDEYPGTGIGLSIARKVAERHGSPLHVEQGPDGGSVFSFTLMQHAAPVREPVGAR